jgi:hypothetical protein
MTPKFFNHFHHIAIIFQIYAIKTDGLLVKEEKFKIQELLNEWVNDSDSTKNILIESSKFLAEYDKKHSDKITDLLNYSANKIIEAGVFSESNLTSMLSDLQDIALSDSDEMSENEEMFISYLAGIWGIEL